MVPGLTVGDVQQATKEGYLSSDSKHRYHGGRALVGLVQHYKVRTTRLPTYDNAHACSAATGIPLTLIKSARRSGDVLRSGHIDLEKLLRHIFSRRKEQDWRALREKCDALTAEANMQQARGEVLDKAETGAAIRRAVSAFWFALQRAAELEMPPILKGKDEAAVRAEMLAMAGRMKKTIFADLEKDL